ncbi:MAG: ERAP1-like C-terminal domain-containing protein, partial [Acidimicrobiia bacterium]|nr:ERAP1-like C-terminal domain-containing protein [Acidimicrobiia bacterium]
LDRASGEPVGEIMDTWILQGGYPVIDARTVDGGIELSQRRFLLIPDESDQTTWKVPIGLRGVAGGQRFEHQVLLDGISTTVAVAGDVEWFTANAGGHGFYRVWYTNEREFVTLLEHLDVLDDLERYTVADDAWAFVEAGQARAASFLHVADVYKNETDQAIWQTIIGGLGGLSHHVVRDEDRPAFRARVAEVLGPISDHLGWEVSALDDDLTRRLRGQVIGALGRLAEDADVVARSRQLAATWLDDPAAVDPDVAQACLFTAATYGDEAFYDQLIAGHQSAISPQVGLKLLQAAASVDDPAIVDRTLAAVLAGTIRSQDVSWVIARMFGSRESGTHAWQSVRRQWAQLMERIPPMTVRRMVEGLPALSRPDVAADVRSFFSETPMPAIAMAVAQNLEKLEGRVALRARESDSLPL